MSKINIKNMFKREYRPIILCGIVLIILTGALIAVIFYDKEANMEVPPTPEYKKIEVGMVDFEDIGTNPSSLKTNAKKELSVDYDVITDYYKEGIMLANPQVEYLNDLFVIHSSLYTQGAFVSTATKDGKLNWIYKLEEKDYTDFTINKVIYADNKYYVFADAKHKDEPETVAFILDEKGKKTDFKVLVTKAKVKLETVIQIDDGFAAIYDGSASIQIFYFDKDANYTEKKYFLYESDSNVFYSNTIEILSASYKDRTITLIFEHSASTPANKTYVLTVNVDNQKDTITVLKAIEDIRAEDSLEVISDQNGHYALLGSGIYNLNYANKIENKFDYSKMELENKEDYDDGTVKDYEGNLLSDMENYYDLQYITFAGDDNILVKSASLYNNIYDIFDSNLNIKKRFMINRNTYTYDEDFLLAIYYIDDIIYEIYSHGIATPSIMISKIG